MSTASPPTAPPPADAAEPVPASGNAPWRPPGWLGARAAIDGLACLAIAVLMLRSFLVEGYMISTGSMAPALYGYHKRVVCPTCGELFARGVAFDGSTTMADDEDELSGGGRYAACPNCGQGAIDVTDVPRNHGDQLLVLKHAFEFRPPRRWEVVVFRNPNHPTQAFVKRVAGLRGEHVRVVDGDVYADGEICRKTLESQRAMRIAVFETDRVPQGEPSWHPRWEGDAGWTVRGDDERVVTFAPVDHAGAAPQVAKNDALSWLTYRHRFREGGSHETSVRIAGLPLGFELPESPFIASVRFDPDPAIPASGTITAVGALDEDWERRLRDLSADPAYQAAVSDLAERSRLGSITDGYAYNRALGTKPNAVRDLMVSFEARLSGEGSFSVEMTDGRDRFRLVTETSTDTIALTRATTGETLRSAELPPGLLAEEGATVEMSVMDRQVLVAIDGVEPFAPWTYDEAGRDGPPPVSPVRLGAQGLVAEVRSLALFRDVYYTPGKGKNGVGEPFALGEDEFFVLGDNSPVSLDSRSWPDGAVPASLLLGKPFVVHLPSRPGTLKIGERRLTVRVPDFGRMRYIH